MIKCSDVYTEDLIFGNTIETIFRAIESILAGGSYNINTELYEMICTNKDTVEIEYLLNRQDRYISPLFERILNHYDGSPTQLLTTSNKLAYIIINKFLKGWSKLADAVFSDYNPIQNYNMVEQQSHEDTGEITTTNNETVTNKYKGFNADEMSDVSESETDGSITTETSQTGQKATNELTRSGNIGVTTTQQMIESSYVLARKNLLDIIYKNIDSVLFIAYYE